MQLKNLLAALNAFWLTGCLSTMPVFPQTRVRYFNNDPKTGKYYCEWLLYKGPGNGPTVDQGPCNESDFKVIDAFAIGRDDQIGVRNYQIEINDWMNLHCK